VLGLAAQKDLLTDHPRTGAPRCALNSTGPRKAGLCQARTGPNSVPLTVRGHLVVHPDRPAAAGDAGKDPVGKTVKGGGVPFILSELPSALQDSCQPFDPDS
jgi:hypothetical protein